MSAIRDNTEKLINMLQSPKPNKRYEACELLRVAPAITPEARIALQNAINDPDASVVDAAQRALAIHNKLASESFSETSSAQPTVMEFAFKGFLYGTGLSSVLIFLFFTIFGTCTEVCPYAILYLSPIIGILTAIIAGILGARKIHIHLREKK
jgi:hypothetical protein